MGAAIEAARQRTRRQLTVLQRSFGDIVEATELDPPDDEHDPEGSTIAYERAQVSALVDQAKEDLKALDVAAQRVADGTATTCDRCRGTIAVERLIALPTTVVCVSCADSV
ncbi:MAG: TraR/DksA C4-type zinc finger protein [Acidimicrobiia bacterium]|nr:TraR/DksA C4-type zinc finger protein [Acidimicrobiia bacterium]